MKMQTFFLLLGVSSFFSATHCSNGAFNHFQVVESQEEIDNESVIDVNGGKEFQLKIKKKLERNGIDQAIKFFEDRKYSIGIAILLSSAPYEISEESSESYLKENNQKVEQLKNYLQTVFSEERSPYNTFYYFVLNFNNILQKIMKSKLLYLVCNDPFIHNQFLYEKDPKKQAHLIIQPIIRVAEEAMREMSGKNINDDYEYHKILIDVINFNFKNNWKYKIINSDNNRKNVKEKLESKEFNDELDKYIKNNQALLRIITSIKQQ